MTGKSVMAALLLVLEHCIHLDMYLLFLKEHRTKAAASILAATHVSTHT